MKVYQKLQQEICEIKDSMKMAGYLDGLSVAATIFCMKHCPEELRMTESGKHEMSITGFNQYLNSTAVDVHTIDNPVLEVQCDQSMSLEECESQISKLYKCRTEQETLWE